MAQAALKTPTIVMRPSRRAWATITRKARSTAMSDVREPDAHTRVSRTISRTPCRARAWLWRVSQSRPIEASPHSVAISLGLSGGMPPLNRPEVREGSPVMAESHPTAPPRTSSA